MNTLLIWAQANPLPTGAAATLLLAILVTLLRTSRTPAAVLVASLAAMACTAYSGDTSWRFAEHRLGMTSAAERGAMFAAAELALFSCALMARQNLRGPQGAPGTPGLLVWFITGVQVIPAYSESGIVGGTVRAVVGPVMAAMLWHLAMGIELRHAKPGAGSQSLPAVIARELRERLLSRLGLATRDRTAEQITRDRATARAVQLASRPKLHRWGSSRLAAAVARSGVGTDPEQLDVMMRMLAARRGAGTLASVELRSPFEPEAPEVAIEVHRVPEVPEAYPAIEVRVPAVPVAVPAGVRLLPIVARPEPAPVVPEPVAEEPSPEPEVYVPGAQEHPWYTIDPTEYPDPNGTGEESDEEPEEPDDDQGYPDPLIPQVRADFPDDVPGVRRLKDAYGIGQPRAQRIRDELMGVRA
ncbi:hypothetical protein [Streptomyces sp. S1D4-20]|uniref:hypothetical protein n=1 Tax=Streptomyces sp. S1D4-20 TaxID=2594462 RepID=UPI00116235B5|nr:hypothetical protein [Streptomyces sp. S1D4-20]QDN58695.1 hypothetical protein FNV67_28300 [Streptomyces sp. S1D4-20]